MQKLLLLALIASLGFIQPAQPIHLQYFPKIPAAANDGCSERYTYDSIPLKKQKYIFAGDMQEHGFIYVDGKEIALKRTGQTLLPKNIHKDVFKGMGYTVTLLTKEGKPIGDEGGLMSGTIEITYGASTLKLKIHGTAGC